jgi:hypothetical protein
MQSVRRDRISFWSTSARHTSTAAECCRLATLPRGKPNEYSKNSILMHLIAAINDSYYGAEGCGPAQPDIGDDD